MIAALVAIVGSENVVANPVYHDTRNRRRGRALCAVYPRNTDEVAAVVRVCFEHHTPVIPVGGATGHMSGHVPEVDDRAVVINLQRLDLIRCLDANAGACVAEAGVTLQTLRQAAEAAGLTFPLYMASAATATVGGILSTNAGGEQTLRYGSARALTLGLEVVLPDGTIWHGLSMLTKNNAGYDLKQTFIGAEGTLGLITAASLRLVSKPRYCTTVLTALPDLAAAAAVQSRLQTLGGGLSCCELISATPLRMVLRNTLYNGQPHAVPFATIPDYTLLLDVHAPYDEVLAVCAALADNNTVLDAIATDEPAQAQALHALRDAVPEAQRTEGPSLKHDIAVPRGVVAEFVALVNKQVQAAVPGSTPVIFGHIAEGNLHYNFSLPSAYSAEAVADCAAKVHDIVHKIVCDMQGSIAAEHGIGRVKRELLASTLDPVALRLMRDLKNTFDSRGVMNPGCIL